MIVYCATCPEGRSYIGITRRTLEYRRRQHMRVSVAGSSCKFHKALRYWGDQMEWVVIDTCRSIPELRDKEREHIASYNSYAHGYNSTEGGEYTDLYQGERIEDDGTVVQLFAASERGRHEGQNITVVISEGRPATKRIDLAAIEKFDRAKSQRETRRSFREAKKAKRKNKLPA